MKDKKYIRYVVAVLVLICMAVILARCTDGTAADKDPASGVYQKFSEDAHDELNELIEEYYKDYAAGDIDAISKVADPLSDAEKSYIQVFSQYVEEYQNLKIYSKRGADEKSYLVSVYLEMKFKDIKTPAAGLDFFYVQTNEDGDLYINNRYSSFNQANGEYEMDDDIASLIALFEQQDDVLALQAEAQQKYNEAITKDNDLQNFVDHTLQDAIAKWAQDYKAQVAAAQQAAKEAEAAQKAAEEAAAQQAAAQKAAEEAAAQQQAAAAQQQAAQQQQQQAAAQQPQVTGIPAGQKIRLTQSTNIRSAMSETSSRVALAYAGESVTVQMSYAEGWTKVTYNNQEGYVRTDVLLAQLQ